MRQTPLPDDLDRDFDLGLTAALRVAHLKSPCAARLERARRERLEEEALLSGTVLRPQPQKRTLLDVTPTNVLVGRGTTCNESFCDEVLRGCRVNCRICAQRQCNPTEFKLACRVSCDAWAPERRRA